MNILIDIGHPAHIHFFRYAIEKLQKDHNILVLARDKDIVINLMDDFHIPYVKLSKAKKGLFNIFVEFVIRELKFLKICLGFRPKVALNVGGGFLMARALGITTLTFSDTEHAKLQNDILFPASNIIFTPMCFLKDLGKKQVRYEGFHELAYLHPNRFTPNPEILKELGLSESDRFFVVRMVAWGASHDIGHKTSSLQTKLDMIHKLEKHGRVFLSTESELSSEFEKFRLKINPTKMHDLLYYAYMYVGESGTMATESSLLGTPSILVSPLAKLCGNHQELQGAEMQYYFDTFEDAMPKITELLNTPDLKSEWHERTVKFLKKKIDVTNYIIERVNEQ